MVLPHDLTANDLHGPHCILRPPHAGSVRKPTHCNHLNEKSPKTLMYFNTTSLFCYWWKLWNLQRVEPWWRKAIPGFSSASFSLSPSLLPLCTRNGISTFWVPCLPCRWTVPLVELYAKTKPNKKPKRNPFPLTCSFIMECFHSYCYTRLHSILVQSC